MEEDKAEPLDLAGVTNCPFCGQPLVVGQLTGDPIWSEQSDNRVFLKHPRPLGSPRMRSFHLYPMANPPIAARHCPGCQIVICKGPRPAAD